MKKIIIIGGGTAGWLTALVINKFWKNTDVLVIESSKIGILGAGEGSTPNFGRILTLLQINQKEFFEKTGATVKTGLNFINWTLDKRQPKHLFKAPQDDMITPPNAYHFDGTLVGKYFKEIATQRGVNYIDNEVLDVKKSNETIHTIILGDGSKLDNIDFVFDCSGFSKVIIDKVHNESWVSYNDYLSLNKAIGYFLPPDKQYKFTDKTYTHLVSMNSGWMWQIPLQHRWGCGYVFNDSFTTIEDAKKEIEKYVGNEITIQKVFDFNPGRFKRSWIGNSIAIGLSYGFIEPLEATSLMSTIMQLKRLIDINFDETKNDLFNKWCADIMEQNMMFIRYHYLCERFDTPFWKKSFEMPIPKKLEKLLNKNNDLTIKTDTELLKLFEYENISENEIVFGTYNYRTISKKNKIINKKELI